MSLYPRNIDGDLLCDAGTLPRVPAKGLENGSTAEEFSARMQALVMLAALPQMPGEKQASSIDRAARRLGLNGRRARAFWHTEARQVQAHEHASAVARVAPMAARMAAEIESLKRLDLEFHGPQIEHMERLLRQAGYLKGD
jgi:hypothetical protein